ncbi:MAG: glycoside hydrolase family 3 C-terminal domain-containing protein, partial [Flavisolibacter sp.]
YEKAVNFTNDTLLDYTDISNLVSWKNQKGFYAEYFDNKNLEGSPVLTRYENTIAHELSEGQILSAPLKSINYSARYSADFTPVTSGDITFELNADDGYRFFVDGKELINAWTRNRWGARTYKLKAEKNKTYRLVVEYYQGEGNATVKLRTGKFKKTDFKALANRVKDADAIIFAGGISPQLEGEEMKVDFPGFNGGDRTTIQLPKVQTEILKALKATGKPVVFVMMTGSAIAIPWEAANVPAIVNAWYGGQSAGRALADVLFGDYNPAGRLPITFYKSDKDLPDFNDYSMKNRTYRYFTGLPLYGFGYGLSYTSFRYDQLQLPLKAGINSKMQVSVRVTNTGKMDGEEVVQLYVSNTAKKMNTPVRSLKGFTRISLKAGESRIVSFDLKPEDLSIIGDDGNALPVSGKVMLSVGGSQPDAMSTTKKKTINGILNL